MKNKFKGSTCVITGGAGLIGSYLSEFLVEQGANVFVIDDLSKGKIENLESIKNRYTLIQVDLEDSMSVNMLPNQCDYFFHLASRAYGIGYSCNNHMKILKHNDLVTNTVIEYMCSQKFKGALIASSSCVYPDNGPEIMIEESSFIGEPEIANFGYGWAKRILEKKIEILKLSNSYPISVVRPLNIYGERYNWQGEHSQAIPMIIKRVMESKDRLSIWGSGNQRRNYLHALDCARIMAQIVANEYDGTVNIGTEDTISLNELALLIINKTDLKLKIVNDLSKPEGRLIKCSNTSRLKSIIGDNYTIDINLERGIELMIDWYDRTFTNSDKIFT